MPSKVTPGQLASKPTSRLQTAWHDLIRGKDADDCELRISLGDVGGLGEVGEAVARSVRQYHPGHGCDEAYGNNPSPGILAAATKNTAPASRSGIRRVSCGRGVVAKHGGLGAGSSVARRLRVPCLACLHAECRPGVAANDVAMPFSHARIFSVYNYTIPASFFASSLTLGSSPYAGDGYSARCGELYFVSFFRRQSSGCRCPCRRFLSAVLLLAKPQVDSYSLRFIAPSMTTDLGRVPVFGNYWADVVFPDCASRP